MPNIQPYIPSVPSVLPTGRQARQEARAHSAQLARIERTTDLRIATAQAVAEVQQAKADTVARVGAYTMQQAALVSQMATQLALAAPTASGDLDYLKTLTIMQLGQVVTDTGRQVNRS